MSSFTIDAVQLANEFLDTPRLQPLIFMAKEGDTVTFVGQAVVKLVDGKLMLWDVRLQS